MRPVCIKAPLSSNVYLFGDLWITAVLATSDYEPNEGEVSHLFRGFDWLLRDRISFCGPMPKLRREKFIARGNSGSFIPCCLDAWPMHLGFWHGDYFQLGVSLPASYLYPGDLDVACSESRIELFADQALSGTVSIWHDDWSPLYPKNGTTRCGLLTEVRKSDISWAEQEFNLKLGWQARLRLWRRDKEYAPFVITERHVYFGDSAA
jgi:hypothetical protein